MYTCQAIANGTRDLALKTNTLTFTTADRSNSHALQSDALRVKRTTLSMLANGDFFIESQYASLLNGRELLLQYPRAGREIMLTLQEL
jgi:hypothetical protein